MPGWLGPFFKGEREGAHMVSTKSDTTSNQDSESDALAREVIDLCAAALRDLNNGQPLPAHWLSYLKQSVWPQLKRGRRPIPRNTQRDKKIAQKMLDHYIALEKGETDKGITKFAEELAEQYHDEGRAFQAKDIFDIYSRHQSDVMSQEICRRLDAHWSAEMQARTERAKQINARVAAGESRRDILNDPSLPMADFVEIRREQIYGHDIYSTPLQKPFRDYPERLTAIRKWIDSGVHLGIDYDSVPDTVKRVGADFAPRKTRRKPAKNGRKQGKKC